MAFLPKRLDDRQGFDIEAFPPGHLITGPMRLPMMTAVERHGELIKARSGQSAEIDPDVMGSVDNEVARVQVCYLDICQRDAVMIAEID
jgi:hypothetical protein